ncbi:MAG: ABC transporter substrate-binding protein [Oscillospiraceae bacterium]|nr:ABC transporter substrate-binding protein [Oscillospiraceae bacterium]
MKRISAAILAVLTIALCLCGCGAKKDEPLRIGLLSIDDSLPFFMAQELGLYEKHGVEVELIPFGSAADKESALEAGRIDGDMTDLVVTALLKKGGTDVKIVSVALGAESREGRFALLAAPDSEIESLRDLSGVPVAVGDNTIVHYLNDRILSDAGVEDIKTQNIPSLSLRYEALLNGSVAAAVLPDPLASLAAMSGAKVLFDDTESAENLSQSVVIFTADALEKKGEQIEKAMAAYFEAMEYINANPDAHNVRGAVERFSSVPESIFDVYETPSFTPAALPAEDTLSSTMDWMMEQGLLQQGYTYAEMVDDTFCRRWSK